MLPLKARESKYTIFLDIERSSGHASWVKVEEKGEIVETLEMFVWTPFKIQWSIGHQMRIDHKKKVMTKEGKVVDYVDQKICIQKLEQFATNAKYVVCHDEVDYQTLYCMVQRNETNMANKLEKLCCHLKQQIRRRILESER